MIWFWLFLFFFLWVYLCGECSEVVRGEVWKLVWFWWVMFEFFNFVIWKMLEYWERGFMYFVLVWDCLNGEYLVLIKILFIMFKIS